MAQGRIAIMGAGAVGCYYGGRLALVQAVLKIEEV